jgi:hypothetical protein
MKSRGGTRRQHARCEGKAKLAKKGCAAATAHLLRGSYRRIYLRIDDYKLAAIKTCLNLGYRPLLHTADMEERWRKIRERLQMPFQPLA